MSQAIFIALPLDFKPEDYSEEIQKNIDDWKFDDITKEDVIKAFNDLINPKPENIEDIDDHSGYIQPATSEGNVIFDICMDHGFVLLYSPYVDSESQFIINVTNKVWLEKLRELINT